MWQKKLLAIVALLLLAATPAAALVTWAPGVVYQVGLFDFQVSQSITVDNISVNSSWFKINNYNFSYLSSAQPVAITFITAPQDQAGSPYNTKLLNMYMYCAASGNPVTINISGFDTGSNRILQINNVTVQATNNSYINFTRSSWSTIYVTVLNTETSIYGPPIITPYFNCAEGFNQNHTGNIRVHGISQSGSNLDINITINGSKLEYFNQSIANNTYTQTFYFNLSNTPLNYFYIKATDAIGNFIWYNGTYTVYDANITLVYYSNGTVLDMGIVSGLNATVPEQGYFFNMKLANTPYLNYTTDSQDSIRFEINYSGLQGFVTRYLNVGLVEPVVNVSIPTRQTMYENVIYSGSRKAFAVVCMNSSAYVCVDYTRFAYGNYLAHYVYTVDALYYLYTYDENGNKIVLCSIDGGKASEINLDALVYTNASYDFSILSDEVNIQKLSDELILIYYLNSKQDNIRTDFAIYDNDILIFYYAEYTSPNELNIYFDFSTISTSGEPFKLVITKYKTSGRVTTETLYFTQDAAVGQLPAPMVVVLALILALFGITFVATPHVFNFIGVVFTGIAIGITTMSAGAWYVTFTQAILIIIMVFQILVWQIQYPHYVGGQVR